jgi:hypothetical protein
LCTVLQKSSLGDATWWGSSDVDLRAAQNESVINTCTSNMSIQTLKAAILVVSTTASKDPSADSSGGILKDVFDQEGGGKWEVTETKIVGDVVLDIQKSIMGWTDGEDAVNLIISTGGTGFAVHDSTPEVCEPPQKFGRKYSLGLRPLHLCCINMPPDLFTAC